MTTSYYNTLVLSGGCMKSISSLGSLQYCYETKLLMGIETYVGTSAGAMICFLLAIGYTPIEIITYMCVNNVCKDICIDVRGLLDYSGAVSFAGIQEPLEKMTIQKIGYLPTFADVKKSFNKNLVITTYNYTKGETEYLGYENNPTMPILVAIRMSSNIPLIFEPFEYMKNLYIDGGIIEHFPLRYAMEADKCILGILIDLSPSKSETTLSDLGSVGVVEYIYTLLAIPLAQNLKHCIQEATENPAIDVIHIRTPLDLFNFDLTTHDKLEYFSSGYHTAMNYFIGDRDN